jgi:hypothetical protein
MEDWSGVQQGSIRIIMGGDFRSNPRHYEGNEAGGRV